MDRFKKIYQQGMIDVVEIWVDTQTGVNYVFHRNGNAAGFTPLLDKDGKPVVSQSPSSPKIRNAQVLQTRTYAFLLHDLLMNEKCARRFCNRIYAETPHAVRSL